MKIHHICIQTNSYDESINFYTNVLDFKIINVSEDFNNRKYNTWLELNNFMIELQTGKNNQILDKYNKAIEGIVHFCLYSSDFEVDYLRVKKNKLSHFLQKNEKDIYNINGNKLFKILAPEGTIIEVRNTIEP